MTPLAPILIPLLTALVAGLLGQHPRAQKRASLLGALALLYVSGALVLGVLAHGPQSLALGNWPLPFAIALAADEFSALLVMVAAFLLASVLIYEHRWPETTSLPGLHPLLHALVAACCAIFLAADLFNLYVWFELLLITTLGLMVLGGRLRQLDAAFKYFVLSMLGTLLMLAAIGLLYGATGHLNFSALREAAARAELSGVLPDYVALFALAVLLKAGAFPLFAWLPASYHTLPAPLLALVGGLLTKVAAYVLLRLLGDVFADMPGVLFDALGWLAAATMLIGVLGAAYHWDIRRILAFHIVSQTGYLLLGIALATPASAVGTAFFLIHNILVKANLFLIAGLIFMQAGHYDLRRLGGIYPASTLLSLLFLINAFSLVGVPPSSGFWGKYMLVSEAFTQARYAWGGMALAVGLLTLYSMSKIWGEAFWKPSPVQDKALPLPTPALLGVVLLTLLIVALGLYPDPVIQHLEAATQHFGGMR